MATIAQVKSHLTGMGGGASIDDVVNLYALMERVANTLLAKLDPIETERTQQLSRAVHDDLLNYALPSDYKKLIDLAPVDDRQSSDRASRSYIEKFSAETAIKNKDLSIEANEGTKFLRLNWRSKSAKTLHSMDSLTADGTIAVVGSASGLVINEQYKLYGSASVEFDLVASGDGIQVSNKSTALDLSEWDEMADFIIPVYFSSVSNLTSLTFRWGNDLTANYWTSVAQTTQADGTAFKAGWNWVLFPWSTATETGTVAPASIDSFRLTIAASGAINNIRVDKIFASLGRFFELKYYSQYIFKNSAGTWIAQPTTDDDTTVLSGTALQIFILECRIAVMQQIIKDSRSAYNATLWERTQLNGDLQSPDQNLRMGLYGKYRAEHPSEAKKQVGSYWTPPKFKK